MTSNFWATYEASQRKKIDAKKAAALLVIKRCIDCNTPIDRQSRRCISCAVDRHEDKNRQHSREWARRGARA